MRRAVLIRVAGIACMAWLVAMFGTGSAQEWVRLREEGANFYDIQRSFYKYWEERKFELKKAAEAEGKEEFEGGGYGLFKRWEYDMAPRVYPSGNLPEPDQNARAFEEYLQRRSELMKGAVATATVVPSANWDPLGPTSWVRANSKAQRLVSAASRQSPFIRPMPTPSFSARRPAGCGRLSMAALTGPS